MTRIISFVFSSRWKARFLHSDICILTILFLTSACLPDKITDSSIAEGRPPEENRFVRTTLVQGLKEPMKLAITPDNNIFWVERKGKVNYFSASAATVDNVEVPFKVFTGINDGLLGIALDPEFGDNNFVYLFYSPRGEVPKQHVSRFEFDVDELKLKNEKVLLEIPTQRETCCHSAGAIAFGPDGNLYIAIGDNSSPRTEPAYAPVDERPGYEAYDAQRTSANTNDLRGKILRIYPEKDGSYSIPEGNLFSKGTPGTRAEIYVMGARNPFRFSIDPATGFLYFGDIGPDATKADWYGPESYDEINLVKAPGNYGWPYFVGNNKAYPKYDFATKTTGEINKSAEPVNHSPNNTGSTHLPSAVAPMIWYSYEPNDAFPLLGKGGRSALAGPVYHYDPSNEEENKFPAYYDNALFIYDWMRNWIKVVRLDNAGGYRAMEDFMPASNFSSPIDMDFGADGTLYLLEYGKGWYSDNPDAKLVRISYVSGNRPPVVAITASEADGAVPLEVSFSSMGSHDLDGDSLTYEWRIQETGEVFSKDRNADYKFSKPGLFTIGLSLTDGHNNTSASEVEIVAGNTKPAIDITVSGNSTFYWPGRVLDYSVKVSDAEDGHWPEGTIRADDVDVVLQYSDNGENLSPVITGARSKHTNRPVLLAHPGKLLIEKSDCQGCHLPDKESIGPSYTAIALRYRNTGKATMEQLASKIIKGGGGVWNRDFVMVGHPDMSPKAAMEIVKYIYSFADEKPSVRRLDPQGRVMVSKPSDRRVPGNYYLTATYKDQGGESVPALTASVFRMLIPRRLQAEKYSGYGGQMRMVGDVEDVDSRYVNLLRSAHIYYEDIDLTDVTSISVRYSAKAIKGSSLECRMDSLKGPLLAKADVNPTGEELNWRTLKLNLEKTTGKHMVYIIAKNAHTNYKQKKALIVLSMDHVQFNFKGVADRE